MMRHSFEGYDKEKHAMACGRDLSISLKDAIEIGNYLRHKKLKTAKDTLTRVLAFKQAIPYKKFTNGIGHKAGDMTNGRYPIKAAKAFLAIIASVEANAQAKGLAQENLKLIHIAAHKAATPMHYGRHPGREMKRTHLEIVLGEKKR